MKFTDTRPISYLILFCDLAATVFFVVSTTFAWNYFYRHNTEYRLTLWGYILTEPHSNKIRSYRDFSDFAELAALLSMSHIVYFVAGCFICVFDLRRCKMSTTGQLRRTNLIISFFFILYTVYQVCMLLAWTFKVNVMERQGGLWFNESVNANPRMGYWFSVSAMCLQAMATIMRTLQVLLVRNRNSYE